MVDWAAIFGVVVFIGGFCLLLIFGDSIMGVLYKFVPPYKRWVDKQIDNLPDWEEDENEEE